MSVHRASVFKMDIEDRPGSLRELLSATAEGGVNILNLAAFSTGGGKGAAFCMVDKPEALEQMAASKGMALEKYAGFLIDGPDEVGVGADVTKPIADASINMVLSTALVVEGQYYLMIVVEGEDAKAAQSALGSWS